MMNEDNKKDLVKLLRGKALYAALAAVVLVAAVVSIQTAGTRKALQNALLPTGETRAYMYRTPTTAPYYDEALDAPLLETPTEAETAAVFENDTPTRPAQPSPTQEPTTAPAQREVLYRAPLTGAMGADYSRGVPVYSDTMGDYRTHNGVDFMGETGAEVRAIGEGKVLYVTQDVLSGYTVTVAHPDGVVSAVSGLAPEDLIREGAEVSAGTVIGRVGELPLEAKAGAHVHLETRRDGVLCDPLELLGLTGAEE